MTSFALVSVAIMVVSVFTMYRLAVGRTLFDRMLALAATGTNSVALILLVGYIFGRPDVLVDVALAYALLNFIGIVVVGKYLELRREQ